MKKKSNVTFSVVVVTYNRLSTIESVLSAWLKETDEVFLCDCSGGKFKTDLPIVHIQFSKDLGNKTMHAAALLTQGDFVILADDDILPKPGLIQDLYRGYIQVGGDCIVGYMGRRFKDNVYFNSKQVYSFQIEKPMLVNMLGICYFSPRKFLAYDLKDMETPINDLYWTSEVMGAVKKWVVPSKKIESLPNCMEGIWTDKKRREFRLNYYKNLFDKYYVKRTGMDESSAKKLLFTVADVLEDIGVGFFLYCGTLLGAIREKKFIKIDLDIDLAMLQENLLPVAEVIKSRLVEKGIGVEMVNHRHKRPWDGSVYAIKFHGYGEHGDLGGFAKINGKRAIPSHLDNHWRVHTPRFLEELNETEFYGRKFKVAKDTDGLLTELYGNWRIPHKKFNSSSPCEEPDSWRENI